MRLLRTIALLGLLLPAAVSAQEVRSPPGAPTASPKFTGVVTAPKYRVMWGLSGPVTSSDAAQTIQNTDVSADTILTPITATGLFYVDNTRNAVVVPAGTTAVNVSAHGCYLRNDNPVSKDPTYGETVGVGVCDWGVALANADNAAVWGAARYLSDTANNSVPVPNRKGVGLIA
ncbi:hypothetical protein, partial [Methylobacterium indicum]